MSTVNLAETVAKLTDRGVGRVDLGALLDPLKIEYVPFTEAQAIACGELRAATRSRGQWLGDRACLALATELGVPAMTADAAWRGVTSAEVVFIR
jgi:PIN domain nuclease of toxin-antitoxin system